jgi:hypothetical protein
VRTRSESRRKCGKVPACVAERIRYDTAHRHVSLNLVGRASFALARTGALLRAKCALANSIANGSENRLVVRKACIRFLPISGCTHR